MPKSFTIIGNPGERELNLVRVCMPVLGSLRPPAWSSLDESGEAPGLIAGGRPRAGELT